MSVAGEHELGVNMYSPFHQMALIANIYLRSNSEQDVFGGHDSGVGIRYH